MANPFEEAVDDTNVKMSFGKTFTEAPGQKTSLEFEEDNKVMLDGKNEQFDGMFEQFSAKSDKQQDKISSGNKMQS